MMRYFLKRLAFIVAAVSFLALFGRPSKTEIARNNDTQRPALSGEVH